MPSWQRSYTGLPVIVRTCSSLQHGVDRVYGRLHADFAVDHQDIIQSTCIDLQPLDTTHMNESISLRRQVV